jgi:hypothetical protein
VTVIVFGFVTFPPILQEDERKK